MTPEEFKDKMKKIVDNSGDLEQDHILADDLLCLALQELGYSAGLELYHDLEKWYA